MARSYSHFGESISRGRWFFLFFSFFPLKKFHFPLFLKYNCFVFVCFLKDCSQGLRFFWGAIVLVLKVFFFFCFLSPTTKLYAFIENCLLNHVIRKKNFPFLCPSIQPSHTRLIIPKTIMEDLNSHLSTVMINDVGDAIEVKFSTTKNSHWWMDTCASF